MKNIHNSRITIVRSNRYVDEHLFCVKKGKTGIHFNFFNDNFKNSNHESIRSVNIPVRHFSLIKEPSSTTTRSLGFHFPPDCLAYLTRVRFVLYKRTNYPSNIRLDNWCQEWNDPWGPLVRPPQDSHIRFRRFFLDS